jgi:stearoyl-CoA desaturase (delta-9 desaturase)
MAAQGPLYYWVAIHRRHHAHNDEPGDPHSPHLDQPGGMRGLASGFWHSHIGWMFSHDATNWPRYIHDLLRDRMLFTISRLYFFWVFLGLLIPTAIGGLLTESWQGALTGFLWGGLVRIFLVHHAAWSLGSVSHLFGYQEFDTKDHSTIYWVTALPTFGESWHNNHHAFPYSATHGLRWWQFDVNATFIRCLSLCGLVWGVKKPTPDAVARARLVKA